MDIPRRAQNKRAVGYVATELGSEGTQGVGECQEALPPSKAGSSPKICAQNYYPISQVWQQSHKAMRQFRNVEINEDHPHKNKQGPSTLSLL